MTTKSQSKFLMMKPSALVFHLLLTWILAALFFSMWHLVNLGRVPAPYLLFQLAYTFAGGVITGLARQWTGSVLYTTAAHMAVNWIAWAAG